MNRVSIICLTYNQEKYIEEALEGFLMQNVNFQFEVLIHDDASTDSTQKIIRRYQKKYPSIFKPVFEKQNQFSKNNLVFVKNIFQEAKGEYIALCEGDDYWTDPNKLQQQVNFLDKNRDYALCFHPVKVIFEGSKQNENIFPESRDGASFNVEELLKSNFIQTNSVMYRRQNYENLPSDILPLDWYLHLYHAQYGKVGFVNKVMSVYRRHPGGIWWESTNNIRNLYKKYGSQHLNMYFEIFKLYQNRQEYKDIVSLHINELFKSIVNIDAKEESNIVKTFMLKNPDRAAYSVIELFKNFMSEKAKLQSQLNLETNRINQLEQSLKEYMAINKHYNKMLKNPIYYSKTITKKIIKKRK